MKRIGIKIKIKLKSLLKNYQQRHITQHIDLPDEDTHIEPKEEFSDANQDEIISLENLRNSKKNDYVIAMAKYYINHSESTFEDISSTFKCSSSTVSKYLNKLLPSLDYELFSKVKEKKLAMMRNNLRQFSYHHNEKS